MNEKREQGDYLTKLVKYGAGPWVIEPDCVDWEYKGYRCCIERQTPGYFVSKVAVDINHVAYCATPYDLTSSVFKGLVTERSIVNILIIDGKKLEDTRVWLCINHTQMQPYWHRAEEEISRYVTDKIAIAVTEEMVERLELCIDNGEHVFIDPIRNDIRLLDFDHLVSRDRELCQQV